MKGEAARFLPPGAHVVALPNARAPRLYLASETVRQRWRHGRPYPAFRWTARLHAGAVRFRAALGLVPAHPNPGGAWPFGDFLEDCLPGVDATVVVVGTSGPASKLTVQLWRAEAVVGYVKFATAAAAVARLEHEAGVVAALPAGLGPAVLKLAPFDGGRALVTAAVPGRAIPPRLPMHPSVRRFLEGFPRPRTWPVDRHPWVARLRERTGERLEDLLEPLAGRSWAEVVVHGDFAPWNVLRSGDGRLVAIDWEYGDLYGFPHLDAAYYHLQVGALLRRWAPERARSHAVRHLDGELTSAQADALVRLSALSAHHEARVDGHPPDAGLQAWRWAVWSGR